jgi:hypothetical protein
MEPSPRSDGQASSESESRVKGNFQVRKTQHPHPTAICRLSDVRALAARRLLPVLRSNASTALP